MFWQFGFSAARISSVNALWVCEFQTVMLKFVQQRFRKSGHRGHLVPSLLECVPNQCSISFFSSFKAIFFLQARCWMRRKNELARIQRDKWFLIDIHNFSAVRVLPGWALSQPGLPYLASHSMSWLIVQINLLKSHFDFRETNACHF